MNLGGIWRKDLLEAASFVLVTSCDPNNDSISQQALQKLIAKANTGDSDAQRRLGLFYCTNRSLMNMTNAIHWLRESAIQGNSNAQLNLGDIYYYGNNNVPKDDVEAIRWYRKTAEHGAAAAHCNLGNACANGSGMPGYSVQQAYAWCSLAAEHGIERAEAMRDSLKASMTAQQLAEAEAFSRSFHPNHKD